MPGSWIDILPLISVLLVFSWVAWLRRLTWKEFLSLTGGALVFGAFIAWRSQEPASFSFMTLFGGAILILLFFSKKALPKVHEGELALSYLTFLYVLSLVGGKFPVFLLVLSLPFLVLLLIECFSSRELSEKKRFSLSLLFSLIFCFVSFYQLSFVNHIWNTKSELQWWEYLLQNFSIQLSIFWGVAHAGRFLHLLPGKGEYKYWSRLREETIPEYADQVSRHNIPRKLILAAAVVHSVPLYLNYMTEEIPAPLMIMWALIASPVLVHWFLKYFVGGEMKRGLKTET